MKRDITEIIGNGGNLFVDAENIDGVLGHSILKRKPGAKDRPRIQRLRAFVDEELGSDWRIFLVFSRRSDTPALRKYALMAIGNRVELIFAEDFLNEDEFRVRAAVVDLCIRRALACCGNFSCGVGVASHDHTYGPLLLDLLLQSHGRKVVLLGFPEFLHSVYTPILRFGLKIFDLEIDCGVFDTILPRKIRGLIAPAHTSPSPKNPVLRDELPKPDGRVQGLDTGAIEHARATLVQAIESLFHKTGKTTVRATTLKLTMLAFDSSFKERALGFRSFSAFLKANARVVRYYHDLAGGYVIFQVAPSGPSRSVNEVA